MFKIFIAFVAMVSIAYAEDPSKILFHAPASEAERALDEVLTINKQDKDFGEYVMGTPFASRNKDFSIYFSKEFLNSTRKSYADVPQEEDGGKYIDIDFITCEQDTPDAYLYHTVSNDGKVAYIQTVWSPVIEDDVVTALTAKPHYRMIKQDRQWKLDGAFCLGDYRFNTDFNYSFDGSSTN